MSDPDFTTDERSLAREAALLVLYEASTKGSDPRPVLDAAIVPHDPLVHVLVNGVEDHRVELDLVIEKYAAGWSLDRMPVLDLLVLRLATFELTYRSDVPVAVVIDEAVEMAKRFSTDDSGRFVNGVLASIAREVR
ncbi:MAG: transcription antitermination factor NusB [Actinomycetota bacterium]|nr:transcription antitermination factor NusB [Actinomycetota bacterium]MDA3000168.1 transcription antitermination factor NusB [Actinomycetota bacterium]